MNNETGEVKFFSQCCLKPPGSLAPALDVCVFQTAPVMTAPLCIWGVFTSGRGVFEMCQSHAGMKFRACSGRLGGTVHACGLDGYRILCWAKFFLYEWENEKVILIFNVASKLREQ